MKDKSQLRLEVEKDIHLATSQATSASDRFLEQNRITVAELIDNPDLLGNFQQQLQGVRIKYLEAYDRLLKLEPKENYSGYKQYQAWIHTVLSKIPKHAKEVLYYPFSGLDFQWGDSFGKAVFEDENFGPASTKSIWWSSGDYQETYRNRFAQLLKSIGVLSEITQVEYSQQDAHSSKYVKTLNNSHTTLLIRTGHDIVDYMTQTYPLSTGERLEYGCCIYDSPANPHTEVHDLMTDHGYKLFDAIQAPELFVAYALSPGNTFIYLKSE